MKTKLSVLSLCAFTLHSCNETRSDERSQLTSSETTELIFVSKKNSSSGDVSCRAYKITTSFDKIVKFINKHTYSSPSEDSAANTQGCHHNADQYADFGCSFTRTHDDYTAFAFIDTFSASMPKTSAQPICERLGGEIVDF